MQWIRNTDATLGGIETGNALNMAYRTRADLAEAGLADVLLITDGQTYDVESLIATAKASEHRHMTIGVGTTVAEDLVRGLAEATAGLVN